MPRYVAAAGPLLMAHIYYAVGAHALQSQPTIGMDVARVSCEIMTNASISCLPLHFEHHSRPTGRADVAALFVLRCFLIALLRDHCFRPPPLSLPTCYISHADVRYNSQFRQFSPRRKKNLAHTRVWRDARATATQTPIICISRGPILCHSCLHFGEKRETKNYAHPYVSGCSGVSTCSANWQRGECNCEYLKILFFVAHKKRKYLLRSTMAENVGRMRGRPTRARHDNGL